MKKISLFTFLSAALILNYSALTYADTLQIPIKGTTRDSKISGVATFAETTEGLKVSVEITGAPSGKHGLHIHENGSCDDQGMAAGSHFNPDKVPHGLLAKDGVEHAHAGDLGNIEISPEGTGKYEATLPHLKLQDKKYGVEGRAIVLHEKEDDFGQPTGNAGGRIGCGVILQN